MRYRVLLQLVCLLFPTVSFSAVSVIMLDPTARQLRDEIPSAEPVDTAFVVAERDAEVVNLDKKHKPGKQMLLIGGAEVETNDGVAKALAALGGAIGGALYGAAQNFQVEKGKASLSTVGVVEIFAE